MAVYSNIKLFDYYEANRSAKSELAAQEVLDLLMQEDNIAIVYENKVVGYVREKRKVNRTIYGTVWISPDFLSRTAAQNYSIHEYEILRGMGGDIVSLIIQPSEQPSFLEKIKYFFSKQKPKVEDALPDVSSI